MENLAGKTKADLMILKELSEAGIEVIEGERSRGEVPYTLTGKLAEWNFSRAWYYWIANAKSGLPRTIATELHKREYPKKEQFEIYGKVIRVEGYAGGIPPTRSVKSYHIDSQEGLNVLAETIRRFYRITSSGTDEKEILRLHEKISAMYIEWKTE
jgi:hypothetical protein